MKKLLILALLLSAPMMIQAAHHETGVPSFKKMEKAEKKAQKAKMKAAKKAKKQKHKAADQKFKEARRQMRNLEKGKIVATTYWSPDKGYEERVRRDSSGNRIDYQC